MLLCELEALVGQTVSGDGFGLVIVNCDMTVGHRHRVYGGLITAGQSGCHNQKRVHCSTWMVALDGLSIVVGPFRMTAELPSKFAGRNSGGSYVH